MKYDINQQPTKTGWSVAKINCYLSYLLFNFQGKQPAKCRTPTGLPVGYMRPCFRDQDCFGIQKCCYNGRGKSCSVPGKTYDSAGVKTYLYCFPALKW